MKKWPKSDLQEATSDLEIEGQGHKTTVFVALPIYLKVLTKIFFKVSRPKGNLCGSGGVTVLNPKYPRLSSGDTMISDNNPYVFVIRETCQTEADTGFSERGAVGCRGYGYFILGHFVAGHIMRCMDEMWVDKILRDKTPVKLAREDKKLAILWNSEGKMPIVSKYFICHTHGQVT